MKSHFLLAAILALLAPLTAANFDLYWEYHRDNTGHGFARSGWRVFNDKPRNCGDVDRAKHYDDSDDVSGNKLGVRCKGDGCVEGRDPGSITTIEMHFVNEPLLHWTIYKEGHPGRRYEMFGMNGRSLGYCVWWPSNEYNCDYWSGWSKMRCLSSISADEINASKLAADEINASKLAADEINASKLAADETGVPGNKSSVGSALLG